MKRLVIAGSVLCLLFCTTAALAKTKVPPVAPGSTQTAPTAQPAPPAEGVPLKPETPALDIEPGKIGPEKLGPNVHEDAPGDCGTTDCPHTFCNDQEGNIDTCHPGTGGCSGSIDTGLHRCSDGVQIYQCNGGQTVHLQNCSCTCLGNACGTHLTVLGCQ
jgi:hypothetical protein